MASGIFRYGLSVISVGVSLSITLLLGQYTFRTPLFFPAIILSTWLGGTGPGFLAALLSALAINFFILEPRYSFSFGLHDLPHLIVFLVSAVFVSSWSAARKRAENLLRDSEQRWHGLTEALPQLVWGATSDGACDYFSTQWTEYTGVPETELLGWQWMKVLHPDDREPIRKFWMDSVAGRVPYDVEYRVQRKDGVYGWFKTRGVPIRDEKGNIEKWFGTCTDITDRKQAEASLQDSESELRKARDELEARVAERTADLSRSNEQLRIEITERERAEGSLREQASLLDLTHDTILVRDMNDIITYWNRGAEEMYGWKREEALGQVTHQLLQTAFPADLTEINAELLGTGRWSGELIHTKRDGTKTVAASRWSLQRDDQGRPIATLETNNDITERKEGEEALARQANLLEQTHDAIIVWEFPRTITYWNRGAERLYGFRREEAVGRLSHELLHTVHPVSIQDFEAVLERDGEWMGELTHTTRDGRRIIVESRHVLLRQAGDRLLVLETNRDITERKQAEEGLRASEEVARGQVEALAQSLDILATAPAPENLIGQMLSTIGRFLSAQGVVLWLLDESKDTLVLCAAAEGQNFSAADSEHPFIKNPGSWRNEPGLLEIFFTGVPAVLEGIEDDPRISSVARDYLLSKGARKCLWIPTLVGGQVKGVIAIRHGDRPPYRPEEIELAQALAHQAMFAVQFNQFAEQSQQGAVLAERNRMARDIHDTLAQGFTGVIVQLEAAEDAIASGQQKEADKHLHRAAGLARQSLNEARRSVHALRPDALERGNFWDALKGIVKGATAGTALHTTCELRGKLPELPPVWQENLLHIGQEALTNTLKYAQARNFRARLNCNARGVRLELHDDGRGFEVRDRYDGLGLTGMRERVEQMKGKLEITSAPDKGTKIVIALFPN
jgi:PAS domain S-box-containing protein